MKIVHVNTYDVGGAATAALRLHEGLLQQHIDSTFLCLYKTSDKPKMKERFFEPFKKPSITERIKRRLGFQKISQQRSNQTRLNGLTGEYEKFSFPFSDYHVETNSLIQNADIIHLHWVADFIHYPSFFYSIQKPVVWTLHDMNPILGGFHYEGDARRNTKFENLEKELIKVKAESVSRLERLTVVTPSKWLNEKAKQSVVFKHASFLHIPYGLDCDTFKMHDKAFSANAFNIPGHKKIILFVCENIKTYRKGFDLLLKAIEATDLKEDYILVTVGESSESIENNHIIHIGSINDERLMRLLFSAADLFILPSREDNFPNVMLEAFACGTPVLSFKTGGMFEVIQEGLNGFFADEISSIALTGAIKKYCNAEFVFDSNVISDFAKRNFALDIQASCYKSLYEEILASRA